ncbi:MAG: DUF4287 domain-containing protein [Longimicrobiales bacterium]
MSGVSPKEQAMIDALPEKTGRSLDQWLSHLAGVELVKHGEVMKHLKGEHDVTHGYANLITHYHRGREATLAKGDDNLLENQYAGAKVELRPIYERIATAVQGFGPDVELAPKKAYVSLRRKKQFGLVQPSTRTRVDIGINLPDVPAGQRLEASGSFNGMVSHRVRVGNASEVDDELMGWLRDAYERAG